MKKTMLVLIFWAALTQILFAQTCFVRMVDNSGFNTDSYQSSLEQSACALQNSLPAQFQSQFKVYDFGFYLHNETFRGFGYPEAFQKAITDAEGQTSSFLLIGKQTDSKGVYSRFYVHVNLPDVTGDGCLPELNSIATNLVHLTIEKEYDQQGINFTQSALKFTVKNKSGSIIFLETGNASAGLQHIIQRHWKPTELMKFFDTQEEMIEKLFISLKDKNFASKLEKNGGFEFVYDIETKLGVRKFKLAVGSNGFIVTFFPQ